jgi:hypothetical protein
VLTVVAVIITVLAMAIVGLYFSGQADDLFVYLAKKYYKAEAKAEEKALGKAGTDKAEAFLKGKSTFPWSGMVGCPRLRVLIDANAHVSRPIEEEPDDGREGAKSSPERSGRRSCSGGPRWCIR